MQQYYSLGRPNSRVLAITTWVLATVPTIGSFHRNSGALSTPEASVRALTSPAGSSSGEPTTSSTTNWRRDTTMEEIKPNLFLGFFDDDGVFPNNPMHPVLIWKHLLTAGGSSSSLQTTGIRRIEQSGWTAPWIWGVFPYHHYHTTAWEVLACVQGYADIQIGGPTERIGRRIRVEVGDVLLIPPGVAHKQLDTFGSDFALLGAYPNETPNADTVRGKPTSQQRQSILECYVPEKEPISGANLRDLYEPRAHLK